ncbi:MAG: hypothetical protein IKW92_00775 [Firmicutes bacterium]|nr:hypothetical protein [Bacillota bacterium]
MKNYLKINHEERTLIMDRTFAKNAEIVGSREYNLLQEARKDYPSYTPIRRTIKKKETQERYKGLTYEYMEWYINEFETKENLWKSLDELNEKIAISKCHSRRYPVIKEWFLEKYPEVKKYGVIERAAAADLRPLTSIINTDEAIPA